MKIEVLERLIGRLFDDEAEAQAPPDSADMAELAALFAQVDRPAARPEGDPAEPLAAWLDGALEGAGRDAFEADLAHAPAERHDLDSAQSFLDAVADHALAAPADLVEAALAGLPQVSQPRDGQGLLRGLARRIRSWRWTIGAVGGAVAVSFSVLVVISANVEPIATTATQAPVQQPTSAIAPANKGAALSVAPAPSNQASASPAAGPSVVPMPKFTPPPAALSVGASQQLLEKYRASEVGMAGAKQGDEAAMISGASAYSSEHDPCAPDMADKAKSATADKSARASRKHRGADCGKGYADRGYVDGTGADADFGPSPYADTAPADAAAMPQPVPSPMGGDAMKPTQPAGAGPH